VGSSAGELSGQQAEELATVEDLRRRIADEEHKFAKWRVRSSAGVIHRHSETERERARERERDLGLGQGMLSYHQGREAMACARGMGREGWLCRPSFHTINLTVPTHPRPLIGWKGSL
jgi:hypothetical protein